MAQIKFYRKISVSEITGIVQPITLIQYDNTIPVAQFELMDNGQAYTLPKGASVSVRMRKPGWHGISNPALSADGSVVLIEFTRQMCASAGKGWINLEIKVGDEVKCSQPVPIIIKENAVTDEMIESGDEYSDLENLINKTEEYLENPPKIGDNGNWEVWDAEEKSYVDTGSPSRGEQGVQGPKGPQGNPGPKGDPGLGVPTPTVVDVGKVPIVNPMGDGYELGEVASDAYTKAESDARYAPIAAAIRPTVAGETISVNDSVEWPLQGLTVYGKSTQDGTPTPDNPIPIVSAGDGGTITVTVSDGADQSQTLPVSTPNGLPGIPVTSGGNYTDADGQQWVCDEVDFARNKYIKRVQVEMLRGSPNFVASSDTDGRFLWVNSLKMKCKSADYSSFSNFAEWRKWGTPTKNKNVFSINVNMLYYSPAVTMTAEGVNELFAEMIASENPPVVLGQLETPIETDLTPEQLQAYAALKTYAPGTTVQTDSTPSAGLSVRYVADAQKYIDNKLNTINTQLLEVKTNV